MMQPLWRDRSYILMLLATVIGLIGILLLIWPLFENQQPTRPDPQLATWSAVATAIHPGDGSKPSSMDLLRYVARAMPDQELKITTTDGKTYSGMIASIDDEQLCLKSTDEQTANACVPNGNIASIVFQGP